MRHTNFPLLSQGGWGFWWHHCTITPQVACSVTEIPQVFCYLTFSRMVAGLKSPLCLVSELEEASSLWVCVDPSCFTGDDRKPESLCRSRTHQFTSQEPGENSVSSKDEVVSLLCDKEAVTASQQIMEPVVKHCTIVHFHFIRKSHQIVNDLLYHRNLCCIIGLCHSVFYDLHMTISF